MILAELRVMAHTWGKDGLEPCERTEYVRYETIEEAKEKTDTYDIISVKCFLIPETPIESWTND